MKYIRSVMFLLALVPCAAAAAPPDPSRHVLCGPNIERLAVMQARHESFGRRLERERRAGRVPVKSAPNVFQSGQVAVMENDGTLVVPPNAFDLAGRGLQLLRRPKGISVVRAALGFKALIGDKVVLGDDDSVRVQFPQGFTFPFGDRVYDEVWLNSDGNLTFGASERFSSRSLDDLVSGPPRLAPLYGDLDPSSAVGENGVYVYFDPGRVRVTWLGVPEFGTHNTNTVQVTLFGNGRATFVYGDSVQIGQAVVGYSAFGDGDLELIDYNVELPFRPPSRVTLAEQFNAEPERDDIAISQEFFDHFRDVYDHVIVWLDFADRLDGAFAFEFNVKNEIQGIGLGDFDFTRTFGSGGRLRSYVQMGGLSRYPADPDVRFLADDSTMSVMGQEAGHRWLAFVRILENGRASDHLLGRDLAHWSFFLDSEGSSMEGNDWMARGDGSFVSTERTLTRYSELDQYVMGLIPSGRVPSFFYIANPSSGSPADNPRIGATVNGTAVPVSVDDVIAAEGRRVPASAAAPKAFRMAFVLVGNDQPVSQASIDHLQTIRQRWESWFGEATDGNGSVKTTLFPK